MYIVVFYNSMSSICCFFFSSIRRHTMYIGDWSSDVCSSDLDDLDGQREFTQGGDQLGVICDADEPGRSGRDDLLASERAAAALDEMAGAGGLIGAVDVEPEIADVIEVHYLDTRGDEQIGRAHV